MSFSPLQAYPLSPHEHLKPVLVGRSLKDVPTPAAIVDLPKAVSNCQLMLDAVQQLGVKFRAHVKTHKTTELTRLQVGAECKDVRLIVSTVIEAEYLAPLLLDYKSKGAKINVLYGVPVGTSQIERLAALARQLGEGSISVMIDHCDQLPVLQKYKPVTGFPISVFIKADAGTHRAGIHPASSEMAALVNEIHNLDQTGTIVLQGFYSHAGHSYGGSSPSEAMEMLAHEVSVCIEAAEHHPTTLPANLTISVGASPTVLSIQNLFHRDGSSKATKVAADSLTSILNSSASKFTLELHAGVYPLLDMQQLATHARSFPNSTPTDAIALSVLAEICSLYPERAQPEALIAAGCLALAREPCKDYGGWGVLTPWNLAAEAQRDDRLIVSRISQEHGIVGYEKAGGEKKPLPLPLSYGQKVRIWPNHACITSAMYGFYIVVDSEAQDPDKIVDVWVRWRGW